jgi:tyrosyl-DNA phosphodiesterase 2
VSESLQPYAFAGGEWSAAKRPAASAPVDVRLLTWNVWFGGHMFEERCAALLADLERRKPDVIALQEVTPDLLGMLVDAPWVTRGYQLSDLQLWQGYDVLILSRLPIKQLSTLELPTRMGRKLLIAELACGLTIATIHLESMKESIAARETQLRLIQPHLAALSKDVALAGDMNFQPSDAIETAALDPSFVDVWPALHPDDPGYTADSEKNPMRFALKPKLSRKRIDRVFVRSARWRPTAIELVGTAPIDIDQTFTSDHFGLEVTLTAIG